MLNKTNAEKFRLTELVNSFGQNIKIMAVLHKKEEKLEAVLAKLPENYTDAQFVETFIQLYSKDWGKIRANYLKQSQDKEPGTVITMPKPELYLKSILKTYLERKA